MASLYLPDVLHPIIDRYKLVEDRSISNLSLLLSQGKDINSELFQKVLSVASQATSDVTDSYCEIVKALVPNAINVSWQDRFIIHYEEGPRDGEN